MTRRIVPALCAAVLLVFGYAYAQGRGTKEAPAPDPIRKALTHIDKGKEALASGKSQEAVDHLQKAIGFIQETLKKQLEAYLPKAPEGFVQGDVETQSGSWSSGGDSVQITTASCDYQRESGDLGVSVQISNSPQIVQGVVQMIEMYDNPEFRKLMQMNPDQTTETLEKSGFKGLLTVTKGESAQVLAVCGKVMLQIDVDKDDAQVAKTFWEATDLPGLAAATRQN